MRIKMAGPLRKSTRVKRTVEPYEPVDGGKLRKRHSEEDAADDADSQGSLSSAEAAPRPRNKSRAKAKPSSGVAKAPTAHPKAPLNADGDAHASMMGAHQAPPAAGKGLEAPAVRFEQRPARAKPAMTSAHLPSAFPTSQQIKCAPCAQVYQHSHGLVGKTFHACNIMRHACAGAAWRCSGRLRRP